MLKKNRATTFVIIDEVDNDNWGIAGEPVTAIRQRARVAAAEAPALAAPPNDPPLSSFFVLSRPQALRLLATWNACEDRHHDVAAALYSQLSERFPASLALVPERCAGHVARLVAAMDAVLAHMDQPKRLQAMIMDYGRRLSSLGLQPGHYPKAMSALRKALADVLGPLYSPEIDADCEVLGREVARLIATEPPQ